MQGRLKRERIYIYIELIHVVVQQKPTQHCKATILQLKIGTKLSCIFLSHGAPVGVPSGILVNDHKVLVLTISPETT